MNGNEDEKGTNASDVEHEKAHAGARKSETNGVHLSSSSLSPPIHLTTGIRHPKSRNFAFKSLNYTPNFTTDNN